MKTNWITLSLPISLLYLCRMLGLFLLMPVFTLLAVHLQGATPQLIGLAFGAYGLTQACMQLFFGWASDRWGRRPLISLGLGLLLLGSLVGAWTTSIQGMILARCLQGAGAIGSVLLALLTDVVPSAHRAKAMAIIGASIGVSFSVAIIAGPVLAQAFGLPGVFYVTAGLAGLGLAVVWGWLPSAPQHPCFGSQGMWPLLRNPVLRQLNGGILLQHALLTSTFFVLPLQLATFIAQGMVTASWKFYAPVVGGSFLVMAPLIVWIERRQNFEAALKCLVLMMVLAQAGLVYWHAQWVGWCGMVFCYLLAFNVGEALLPAQVSHAAPAPQRGVAMGLYSTSQFIGIFLGGLLAGFMESHGGHGAVYLMNTALAIGWLVWININRSALQK